MAKRPKKAKIEIAVSVTRSGNVTKFSYTSDDTTYYKGSGNVVVPDNVRLDIKWKRFKGEKWKFKAPYLTTQKNVGLKPESRRSTSTEWEADNTTGHDETKTRYYLYTDHGQTPDPMLTLEGSGGPFLPKKKRRKAAKKKARTPAKRAARKRAK